MLRERAKILSLILLVGDLGAVVAAFYGGIWLRNLLFSSGRGPINLLSQLPLLQMALPAFAISFHFAVG